MGRLDQIHITLDNTAFRESLIKETIKKFQNDKKYNLEIGDCYIKKKRRKSSDTFSIDTNVKPHGTISIKLEIL